MKNTILVTALFAALSLTACSKPEPLHDSMESMEDSYKSLKKAETLEDKKQLVADFEKYLLIAKEQKVRPEDQKTFDEGIEKLSQEVQALKLQLEQGNIENIKPQLKRLHDLEEEYHELLGVEE
ncbi:cytochrome b562 [Catenovulum sediminis]|uniref:Cytochrome b562 n=1 Tax=Catenovulum sediminis TaxID=1740262 RepID=A0ABV1RHH6_9ALTE|nr:cytochrome b562 [Catenovulum sediminis]